MWSQNGASQVFQHTNLLEIEVVVLEMVGYTYNLGMMVAYVPLINTWSKS